MLLSHATSDLPTREVPVMTPVGPTTQRVLAERIGFAPILRAGAGMIPAAQELLPGAPIWYLGLYRDEETLRPVRYYDKLQGYPPVDIALILDPMLATFLVTLLVYVFLLVYLRPDRIPLAYALIPILTLASVFASGNLQSIGRLGMVAFPYLWVVAGRRSTWFRTAWPALSAGLLGILSVAIFAGWYQP